MNVTIEQIEVRMRCKHPTCRSMAQPEATTVFQLCRRHVDALFPYVNRKPVWGSDGITSASGMRYRGALRMFGWS